jgi:hypothetical protein
MPRKPALDKYHDVLFKDLDEIEHLTPAERKQLTRYRLAFSESLENPTLPDTELRDLLMNSFGISATQAYIDIQNVRILLGNVRNAGKEWVRYLVNETLKKAIEDAKELGPKGIKLVIMAANTLGKYNMLDREDAAELPWEDIIPQTIEPTSDPTVIGGKKLANKEEEIRKMYEKYKGEIEIEFTDYEEIGNERK